MLAHPFKLLAVLLVAWSSTGNLHAQTLSPILHRWEKAASGTKTIDAKFARLVIHHHLRTQETDTGRFYYESSDRWSYQLSGGWQCVWEPGLLLVDRRLGTYRRISHAQHAAASKFVNDFASLPACRRFLQIGNFLLWSPAAIELDTLLPLYPSVDAERVARHYTVTCSEADGRITLRLVPFPMVDNQGVSEIGVILDRKSCSVLAHRQIDKNGHETVHIFDSVVLNGLAADREKVFNPDLTGLADISLLTSP